MGVGLGMKWGISIFCFMYLRINRGSRITFFGVIWEGMDGSRMLLLMLCLIFVDGCMFCNWGERIEDSDNQ